MKPTTKINCDYLVLGAGPAGLQIGYSLQQLKQNFIILERALQPGSFFETFPRQRRLISINKVHTGYDDPEINLRWDWNSLLCDDDELLFKHYSKDYFPKADLMVDYLKDFANKTKLPITYDTEVQAISKADGVFKLQDAKGNEYTAKVLIVATGVTQAYIPDIEGIELADNYTNMSMDKEKYANKRVLVIGKGNSGFETADYLIDSASIIHVCSPNTIQLAWDSHFVGNLRAINNNFLDTYHLKSQNAILDAEILEIKMEDEVYAVRVRYSNESNEEEILYYEKIICCTGFQFDNSIFSEECRPVLAEKTLNRYPDQTEEWESINVKDLYFAGVLTQMRDFKKYASGFIHGFRYNARVLAKILNKKYNQVALPSKSIAVDANLMAQTILKKLNRSSSMWQQYGFLGDALFIDEEKKTCDYHEELPVDYVVQQMGKDHPHYYTVTLEFGTEMQEPNVHSSKTRVHRADYNQAHLSKFIHPIIRRYNKTELVEEFHLIEELFAEWKEDEKHLKPLTQFLKSYVPDLVSSLQLES